MSVGGGKELLNESLEVLRRKKRSQGVVRSKWMEIAPPPILILVNVYLLFQLQLLVKILLLLSFFCLFSLLFASLLLLLLSLSSLFHLSSLSLSRLFIDTLRTRRQSNLLLLLHSFP